MLEMALISWTLSEVMKRGFSPLTTPEIVRSSVVEKCGFQPRGTNTQVCVYSVFVYPFQEKYRLSKCVCYCGIYIALRLSVAWFSWHGSDNKFNV